MSSFSKQAKPATTYSKTAKPPNKKAGRFGFGQFGSAKFGKRDGYTKVAKPA